MFSLFHSEEDPLNVTKEMKQKTISRFQRDHKDTGSSEVQIAVLTERIQQLTDHFKTNPKDHHSRRGLMMMVSKRKKLLSYLRRSDYPKYAKLIQELELRK